MSPSTERGQTLAEYAVVLALITLAIVTTFGALDGAILAFFQRTLDALSTVF